ncbi:MAG: prolipoprotein diacylglyceryl transferase [Paracoccaceae bacterium]
MFSAIIPFPNIGPDIFSVDIAGFTLALRWYALAYIAGIILGWRLIVRALKSPELWPDDNAPMSPAQMEDLLTWIIIGIIAGGRLGFVFFYQPLHFIANPAQIPMVWQGGMSFHGGFIGVILTVWLYSRRHSLYTPSIADALAFATPTALMLGRFANFINAELWGRPSDLPWAVAFPGIQAQYCPDVIGICARHPSQLYEAALEGIMLALLLLFLVWRRGWLKLPGQITGVFFLVYGLSRFVVEFVRQADVQFISADNPMGYVIGTGNIGLSMGQSLSLPMILIGIATIVWSRRRA